ncbi:phage DNA ejection protein [Salmonella enterica]|uniref:phage DNA ejection protein n=1 Tax=Salmonella enterica TaxID=28901 RepID=UPI0015E8DC78|nr:phage DNA ejection protein [Salmonella enterica]EHL9441819.1 phage DNA ejection protein [Salmonella enterica subsp. enterica serovar Newport]EFT3574521.1 phage DNA ejection protein [Salmonella enterica]EFT6826136.1 phage DNA ejection protein [Salmonella enterica]EHL9595201.1 phage DNA ejection protein [Salmonella enterica subsp. enterica serovar Newport]EHM0842633.1 phage DNA ejection protein [Salmonella enterica]
MATFQLAGLPSMQVANQNAPGQPSLSSYDFSQRPNVGVQLAQGIGAVGQAMRLSDFQKAFGQAYAAGDRDALRQLAATNPDQIETIRQGMGFVDADKNQAMGDMSARLNIAAAQGPESVMRELATHQNTLQQIGISPEQAWQTYQQSPEGFTQLTDLIGMHAVGPEKYFDIQDKLTGREIDRGRLAETIRSNKAGEGLQARGQNITMRGQDMSASTARRGQDLAMQRANAKTISGVDGNRVVQLADGRTVNIDGKLHGAGANAFYEGIDDNGNMVRVPASAIAAPPTSAASAQNYAMKKDLDAIAGAKPGDLEFITGVTGGNGTAALGADVITRLSGKEQRQLYNATQRIQGRMQNQGIAAARDMGASGINTVAEAKMYFQGMPQFDFSSPEAAQQSAREIQEYTDNYNKQYNVNVGNGGKKSSRQQPATQQSVGGSYTSKSGIQFTVE